MTTATETKMSTMTMLQEHRFFRDRLSIAILLPTLLINVLSIIILVIKLQPVEFALPTRYSNIEGFNALGTVYDIYAIGLFALVTTIINGCLAITSFHRSRIISFFLLSGAFVVSLFALIVCTAFAGIAR